VSNVFGIYLKCLGISEFCETLPRCFSLHLVSFKIISRLVVMEIFEVPLDALI
jgi:hypothetical protein